MDRLTSGARWGDVGVTALRALDLPSGRCRFEPGRARLSHGPMFNPMVGIGGLPWSPPTEKSPSSTGQHRSRLTSASDCGSTSTGFSRPSRRLHRSRAHPGRLVQHRMLRQRQRRDPRNAMWNPPGGSRTSASKHASPPTPPAKASSTTPPPDTPSPRSPPTEPAALQGHTRVDLAVGTVQTAWRGPRDRPSRGQEGVRTHPVTRGSLTRVPVLPGFSNP